MAHDLKLPNRLTIYGAAAVLEIRRRGDRQQVQIQVFAVGDSRRVCRRWIDFNGTVEMCHTVAYYYVGKDPTLVICFIPAHPERAKPRRGTGGGEAPGGESSKLNVIGSCGVGTQWAA
jgi:hypothetical protein